MGQERVEEGRWLTAQVWQKSHPPAHWETLGALFLLLKTSFPVCETKGLLAGLLGGFGK